MKKCTVQQAQVLDKNGHWMKRSIFMNMDETFIYGLKKVLNDKTIPNTYSTNRTVLYV